MQTSRSDEGCLRSAKVILQGSSEFLPYAKHLQNNHTYKTCRKAQHQSDSSWSLTLQNVHVRAIY